LRSISVGRSGRPRWPWAGDWHDLGGSLVHDALTPVALQPLAALDDAAERTWAAEWLAALLRREGVTVSPEAKEHVWTALTSLASAPVAERTLTGLSVLLQSGALKRALQSYCLDGPYGRLLDAEAEHLGGADVQAFETEGLIGHGRRPRRSGLSVSSDRGPSRRPADASDRG
jgi:type IV secretion system protein VirB4